MYMQYRVNRCTCTNGMYRCNCTKPGGINCGYTTTMSMDARYASKDDVSDSNRSCREITVTSCVVTFTGVISQSQASMLRNSQSAHNKTLVEPCSPLLCCRSRASRYLLLWLTAPVCLSRNKLSQKVFNQSTLSQVGAFSLTQGRENKSSWSKVGSVWSEILADLKEVGKEF